MPPAPSRRSNRKALRRTCGTGAQAGPPPHRHPAEPLGWRTPHVRHSSAGSSSSPDGELLRRWFSMASVNEAPTAAERSVIGGREALAAAFRAQCQHRGQRTARLANWHQRFEPASASQRRSWGGNRLNTGLSGAGLTSNGALSPDARRTMPEAYPSGCSRASGSVNRPRARGGAYEQGSVLYVQSLGHVAARAIERAPARRRPPVRGRLG